MVRRDIYFTPKTSTSSKFIFKPITGIRNPFEKGYFRPASVRNLTKSQFHLPKGTLCIVYTHTHIHTNTHTYTCVSFFISNKDLLKIYLTDHFIVDIFSEVVHSSTEQFSKIHAQVSRKTVRNCRDEKFFKF